MMKLHPDAVPKIEPEPQFEYEGLRAFLEDMIRNEGWNKLFRVNPVQGSELIQVLDVRDTDDLKQAPIVLTESEKNFREGKISRAWIRSECVDFLRSGRD